MLRSGKVRAVFAILTLAVLAIALGLGIEGPRSTIARTALGIYLRSRGLDLQKGQLRVGARELMAQGVVINETDGRTLLSARRIRVGYSIRNRNFAIDRAELDQPDLFLRRQQDGTFNLTNLFGTGGTPQTGPAKAGPPMRFSLSVRDGRIDVSNPTSPVAIGRAFSLTRINLSALIDQGRRSHGEMKATLTAAGTSRPVSGVFSENDVTRFARIRASVARAPLAPVVDLLVATPAFAVQRGTGDIAVQAYALAWNPSSGPAWQVSADIAVRDGRIRVVPLVVPVRDLAGDLHYNGGSLSLDGMTGTAAGVPLVAHGALEILPAPRLAIAVDGSGPASKIRRLLAFSRLLPLEGSLAVHARLAGPASNPHVAVNFSSPLGVSFGQSPSVALDGSLYYHHGHVTLTTARARYAGITVSGNGDIAVGAGAPSGEFIVTSTASAARIPGLANIDPTGEVAVLGTLVGPLAKLHGRGYAQSTGGSTAVRAAFAGGPTAFIVSPLLAQSGDGEIFAWGGLNRTADPLVSGTVIARRFRLHVGAGSTALPGIMNAPLTLPNVDGTLDGALTLRGTKDLPAVGMSVRAHDLTVAGTRFGDARIEGNGTRGQLRIARISVAGGDARIDASGVVTMASAAQPYSGTLSGTGSADLGAFVSGGRIGGRVAGPFTAAFGNGQWLVSANARSTDAVVAGVPVHSVDATVGGDAAGFHLYAGIANFSGGQIAAAGDLPGPGSRGLTVFAHDIDSATLRAAGVPLQRGTMAALGTVAGTQANPNVSMAASLDGGEVAGHALAGDFDGNYDGGRLVARESRVAFLGGSIAFDGTIAGLQSGRPIKAAAVAVDARTSGADLAALSSQFAPKSIPLTGNVIAAVRVGGTIGAPTMAGRLGLDAGTVRGVPFTDFHAAMSAGDGAATVNRGAVRIGGSALRFGGSLTPGAVRLRVGSPHLDLSDFNNFFAGKDIVDGVGSTRLAFSSTTKGTTGNGFVRLSGAQFEGLPLGEVNAVLSTRDRAIVADARQAGNLGSISITGDVAFAAQRGIWPAFDTARYDARSSARDVDLSILAPIVHAEAAGIVGRLSFNAAAHGSPRRLVGDGGFAVRDGRVRDIAIRDLSGQIRSDGHSIEVRRLTVAVDAAQMQAHGRYGPTRKIDARASVQASDLSALGKVLKSSLPLTGSASMTLQAGGTLDKPRVRAVLDAFSGLFDGVAYDKITAAAAYAPGRVELSDTSVQLAKGRGGLVLTGSVPVQLSPFGIGPARQRIGLQLRASDVDLSTFNPLLGPSANLGGKFNAVASATGSAGSPRLAGSASLRNASVNSRFDTIPITGISADAEFVQDSITLKRFHASTGKGSLEARGAAKLVPSRDSAGVRYSAQVAFHDARADVPGYFNGTLNGGLRLAQDAQASSLTGTVAMSDTEVPFASILALATGRKDGPSAPPPIVPGVPKLQKGHTIVYGGALYGNEAQVVKATPPPEGSASKRAAPPIELDVIAQANKNVRVTGIVDVTTVGSVAVVGTASAPELAGVFNSVRGRVGAFGANFQLRRGSVTFDPAEGLLPTIDAQGITYASGTSITVTVTGRVDHLNTDLESEPPLPRDQIIGLLLHIPQLNQALSGGIGSASSQTGYGQVAQNLLNAQLSSQLLAPLTSALAQSLDISEINITFDAQGQPNLELRKQFGARTYAIYSNTFAVPYSQSVGFAYELSDVLAIEFLQNETAFNTPRIGNLPTATINIRYSFR